MKALRSGLLLGLGGLVLTGTGCGAAQPVSSNLAAQCAAPQITVSPDRTTSGSTMRVRGHWLSADCNHTGNLGQEKPYRDLSTRYATDALTAMVRNSAVSYAFAPATLTAALPSVAYRMGDVAIRVSTLVVTGAFTSWEQVPAPSRSGSPRASSTTAAHQTLVLGFRVASVVAKSPEGSRVHVGDVLTTRLRLPVGTDAAKVGRGLQALGPALVFFRGGFTGDRGTWDISRGTLLGSVDPAGHLIMRIDLVKAKGEDTVGGIVIDATTVAQLKEAGQVATSITNR